MGKIVTNFLIITLLGFCIMSCQQNDAAKKKTNAAEIVLKDYGAEPTVLDIHAYSESNDNFRIALWTGDNLQVTLMSIPVGGEIGLESHNSDQFLRIEDGEARVLIGDDKESLTFDEVVDADFAIFVPTGKWHNVINIGEKPLKLYSIYAPSEHPHSTLHQTPEEGEH